MSFRADYYDGRSARAIPVLVEVLADSNELSFESTGVKHLYSLADVVIQPRLGKTRRLVELPDGHLEADNIDTLELAMPSKSNVLWASVHYLENHLGWVAVSLIATVFAGWMFLQYGVPALAERVAKATSPALERKLGEQVLAGLDHKYGYFSSSQTGNLKQQEILSALAALCERAQSCPEYRLEFRDGGMIGANAFALPGGIVVITDELVTLSKNNDEVVAVLAHELGHVKQRHAFRQSIQGLLAGLVMATITGDVSTLASGLPATLMQLQYTRNMETEADNFALQSMQAACIQPKAFADILSRLAGLKPERASKPNQNEPERYAKVGKLLSTHPDTEARIQPFLHAELDCR